MKKCKTEYWVLHFFAIMSKIITLIHGCRSDRPTEQEGPN